MRSRITVTILTVLVTLFIGASLFFRDSLPSWVGVTDKTLWDWIELALFPIIILLIARFFDETQKQQNEIKRKEESAKSYRDAQLVIIQDYLNRIQNLLLDNRLNEKSNDSTEANLARTLTFITLDRLEPEFKGNILIFLNQTRLIHSSRQAPIIELFGANLSGVGSPIGIGNVNLQKANLHCVDLSDAKLDFPDLRGSNLTYALLKDARLIRADLRGANLEGAILEGCNLYGAILDENTILPNGLTWRNGIDLEDWGAVNIAPYSDEEIELTRRELRLNDRQFAQRNIHPEDYLVEQLKKKKSERRS